MNQEQLVNVFIDVMENEEVDHVEFINAYLSLSLKEQIDFLVAAAEKDETTNFHAPSLSKAVCAKMEDATDADKQYVFARLNEILNKTSPKNMFVASVINTEPFRTHVKHQCAQNNELSDKTRQMIDRAMIYNNIGFADQLSWATPPAPFQFYRFKASFQELAENIERICAACKMLNENQEKNAARTLEELIKLILFQCTKTDIGTLLKVVDPQMNNGRLLYWVLSEETPNPDAVFVLRQHIDPVAMMQSRFFECSVQERYQMLHVLCQHFPEHMEQWVNFYEQDKARLQGHKKKKQFLLDIEEAVQSTPIPAFAENKLLRASVPTPAPAALPKKKM